MKFVNLILLILVSISALGQNSDLGNWINYFGNKKVNHKINFHHEIQYRNYNAVGDLEQLLIRAGIGYNLTEKNNNILIGYGFIRSENYQDTGQDKIVINEHRLFQQFITRQSIGRLNVQHRYRFEQRWVEELDMKLRFRYLTGLKLPINNKTLIDNTFYLSSYGEVFLNTKQTIFDRYRLYGGLGYQLSSNLKFELAYMNQFLNDFNRDQININTFLKF